MCDVAQPDCGQAAASAEMVKGLQGPTKDRTLLTCIESEERRAPAPRDKISVTSTRTRGEEPYHHECRVFL